MNKKLTNTLNILLGLLLIGYIIYIRLIVVRLPKNLYLYENNEIKLNILLIIGIGLVFSMYMLKKSIFIKQNNESMFTTTLNKIKIFAENALDDLHEFIVNQIPNNYEKMSHLVRNFYTIFSKKSESFFVFIILAIRIIILIAFILDVFLYFELNLMYKALYLLCISLLIKVWFYILKSFSNNLHEIELTLNIEHLGFDKTTQLPITTYTLKEEYINFDLRYQIEEYLLCSKISGYLLMYEKYSSFFTRYINIIIYSLYLLCWSYVLIVNFLS